MASFQRTKPSELFVSRLADDVNQGGVSPPFRKLIGWTVTAALVLVLVMTCSGDSFRYTGDGERAPEPPVQTNVREPAPTWEHNGYTFTARARIEVPARVLATRRYRVGEGADVLPLDVAFGWGPMSDERLLRKMKISQYGRWYRWKSSVPVPGGAPTISLNSANMHLSPANPDVWRRLRGLKPGDTARIAGYLVDIEGDGGQKWKTSLHRRDIGAGSCEIIWVESVQTLQ